MREIRISIACITFTLIMFGIIMVYSSSAIYAYETMGDSLYFLKRHLFSFVTGILFMFLCMSLDCGFFKKYAKHILLFSGLLLLAVLIPGIGRSAGGARRWIDMGLFNLQPSEIAKISILIYLADFAERKRTEIKSFLYGYLPAMIVLGVFMLLVLLEPDLGTAIAIGTVGAIILFAAGAKGRYLFYTVLASLPVLYYLVFSQPYRKKRLLTFINPWMDEKGAGFQIVQSFLALGSGGLFGAGLGMSRQKLFFLPASHTDFIFSIIGEELGFLGCASVILLFGMLMWQGARAAFKTEDTFKRMLILGMVFIIGFEVIVNTAVTAGVIPTKGLPLPFLSYGGTSLVVHMAAIGLLLNATK